MSQALRVEDLHFCPTQCFQAHTVPGEQAMHDFRDNKATFLLATPAAARGLDLPAVSHVYNLSPPADAVEYLHRAGRVGRIGASTPGEGSGVAACSAVRNWLGLVCKMRQLLCGWCSTGVAAGQVLSLDLHALTCVSEEAFKAEQ